MQQAYIVDAIRTPIGKRGGVLAGWHPVDLSATILRTLVDRVDLDPGAIGDVVMGCTMTVGEQAMNIGRNAALAAGFPQSVPGTTIDRQCGSAQQAIHFAAQAVISGSMDLAIGAGVESMTRIPIGSSTSPGPGEPYGPMFQKRFDLVHQGISAAMIASKWNISREEMDELSCESHKRAHQATEAGYFKPEIAPIEAKFLEDSQVSSEQGQLVEVDQGIRPTTNLEGLAQLRPAFEGVDDITAGNSSQISDGAAAVLIANDDGLRRFGLTPRARIVSMHVIGDDPVMMLTAPIPATSQILTKNSLKLDEIDVIEINEAFASVVLAWKKEFNPDMGRVNIGGGAIALGHPTGCSGARIMATLLGHLERTKGRLGLQTMCEGGGLANATIIERL